MKKLVSFFLIATSFSAKAQIPTLQKVWETEPIFAIPESVLPDMKNNVLYISLINGPSWESDGIGGIGKLSPDGKNYDSTWIMGLNAPKGLGMYKNNLFAADNSEVVVIDIKKGKVTRKIAIEGASGLNDITVDDKGIVYVSDSRTAKVWRIENNQAQLFLEDLKGVNGLKAIGENLFIGAGKDFLKADANKNISKIAVFPQGIDGIEPVGNGDFILTAWSGYVFYVTANGQVSTLLETHKEKVNTADIGYDPKTRMLYIPTFLAKKIIGYKLK